jgi:ketosteroid isomerase-like protein
VQLQNGCLARCKRRYVLRSVVDMFRWAALAGTVSTALFAPSTPRQKSGGGLGDCGNRVDELIAQFDLAQRALVKGNPEPIKKWYSNRQDVTLGNPLGPVVRGWEQVAAVLDHAASQIRDGEMGDAETLTRYVTPELAYVVRVEQSTAKVGGQQAVSPVTLRATMIMRPEDGVWKIVHRHADPITSARQAESVIQQ